MNSNFSCTKCQTCFAGDPRFQRLGSVRLPQPQIWRVSARSVGNGSNIEMLPCSFSCHKGGRRWSQLIQVAVADRDRYYINAGGLHVYDLVPTNGHADAAITGPCTRARLRISPRACAAGTRVRLSGSCTFTP